VAFSREQLVAEAWRRGRLRYKLRAHQVSLQDFIATWRPDESRKVVKCARRFGKSFGLCLYATEFAIQHPGAQIRFAAPTEKALRKIIRPNMRVILADCPERLRPRWNTQDGVYVFPNGSEWHLAGTDKDNAEKLRGTGTDLAIVDEAGFHDDLSYVVDDILTPQLLDNGGRLVMISTPATTPDHPFTARFCPEADAEKSLFIRTIRDNTHLKPEQVERYVKALGGWTSLATRRELLCEDVVDLTRAIVPEFEEHKDAIVKERPRPEHFFPLVAMDVGFEDWHAIGFGYWDWDHALLVVEDEAFLRRATTDSIAAAIAAKETALWPWAAREAYQTPSGRYQWEPWRQVRWSPLRYSDTDLRLIADLGADHGLSFAPTAKDEKEAQVNELRRFVASERIRIHPRCHNLIRHLKTGVWNKQRTAFDRSSSDGHYDGVDMLLYMLRNAPRNENPHPPKYATVDPVTHLVPDEENDPDQSLSGWRQVFGGDNG
jgi:Terminase large subunit, T4likevirus-type, N-terminal